MNCLGLVAEILDGRRGRRVFTERRHIKLRVESQPFRGPDNTDLNGAATSSLARASRNDRRPFARDKALDPDEPQGHEGMAEQ